MNSETNIKAETKEEMKIYTNEEIEKEVRTAFFFCKESCNTWKQQLYIFRYNKIIDIVVPNINQCCQTILDSLCDKFKNNNVEGINDRTTHVYDGKAFMDPYIYLDNIKSVIEKSCSVCEYKVNELRIGIDKVHGYDSFCVNCRLIITKFNNVENVVKVEPENDLYLLIKRLNSSHCCVYTQKTNDDFYIYSEHGIRVKENSFKFCNTCFEVLSKLAPNSASNIFKLICELKRECNAHAWCQYFFEEDNKGNIFVNHITSHNCDKCRAVLQKNNVIIPRKEVFNKIIVLNSDECKDRCMRNTCPSKWLFSHFDKSGNTIVDIDMCSNCCSYLWKTSLGNFFISNLIKELNGECCLHTWTRDNFIMGDDYKITVNHITSHYGCNRCSIILQKNNVIIPCEKVFDRMDVLNSIEVKKHCRVGECPTKWMTSHFDRSGNIIVGICSNCNLHVSGVKPKEAASGVKQMPKIEQEKVEPKDNIELLSKKYDKIVAIMKRKEEKKRIKKFIKSVKGVHIVCCGANVEDYKIINDVIVPVKTLSSFNCDICNKGLQYQNEKYHEFLTELGE